MDVLYHISDRPGIARFEPRPAPASGMAGEVVWAIDDAHLHNYLLPRDCPRVTYYPLAESLPEDVARLMGDSGARAVVAIESRWFESAWNARLYQYELPASAFACVDAGAGYFVAEQAVAPICATLIEDPLGEMLRRGVELSVMPSLWDLRDQIIASTLQFSIIRMRNALPRQEEPGGK